MIDIYFKKCCEHCNHLEPDYEQASGLVELVTVISCRHACVCGKFLAEATEEDPPQDVVVKGFRDAD